MAKRPKRAAEARVRPGHSNQIRIIGGRHRGRKLHFPDLPGLRPTSDRTRETLFNWLQPILDGAACLDLFAGSGALGFEAASRGAGRVVMLEEAPSAVQLLQQNKAMLDLAQIEIHRADALVWLEQGSEPFDLVFLDPPFAGDQLEVCCEKLESGGWLAPGARIYIEVDLSRGLPGLPHSWQCVKQKKAGQVAFFLYTN